MTLAQHPTAAPETEADIALEGALIGAVLANAPYADEHIWQTLDGIKPDHFGDPVLGGFWEVISEHKGRADLQILANQFPRQIGRLADLFADGAPTMLESYAATIRGNYARLRARSAIITAGRELTAGRDPVAILAVLNERSAGLVQVEQIPRSEVWARPYVWRHPASIPRREWLYGGHYVRCFVSVTLAPGGSGKTALTLAESLAMAAGIALHGPKPTQRLRVWVWSGEDPIEETDRRIAALCIHYGLKASDLEGWLFYGSGRDADLVIAEQTRDGATILRPNVDAIIRLIGDLSLDVVVIDPFISSHRVTENDNNSIDRVVKQWATIAHQTNVSVELVHHTRKTGGAEITVEDGRGAVALLAAARSARVLNPMTKEEGERAGIPNHRWFFRVDNGKANLRPPADGTTWFQFQSVDLDNGDLPAAGDSVGVVTSWAWPNALAGVTAGDLLRVQTLVSEGDYRDSVQSPDWIGKAIANVLRLDLNDKADKARAAALYKEWRGNGMFEVIQKADKKGTERPCVVVGKWCTP